LKIDGCEYPESLLYDVEAWTWARKNGNDCKIGIAPHLGWISGGFTSVSFKGVGYRAEMGKTLGSVEGPRHFDVVRAPFDCVIKETNSALELTPKLANKDPFGEGWYMVVEQTGSASRLQGFPGVADSLASVVKRLGVRCFSEFPDAEMFEIGTECSAVLVQLNERIARQMAGWVVHIVSDDPTADIEMTRWAEQTGNKLLEVRREGNLHHFIVKKS
jgi:glycine cleavage system H lipoate-binding protein/TusA-related sulfurtransferase